MKLSNIALLAVVTFSASSLIGCGGLSKSMQTSAGVGGVASTVSGFDGKTEVAMKNAWIANDAGGMSQIGMAFRWNSSSPNNVGIIVRVVSMSNYNNIGAAAMNIDGVIEQLVPAEALTSHDSTRITNTTCSLALGCTEGISAKNSDKMFIADLSLIRRLVAAKTLKIKVDSGRDYRVGDLRKDSFGNVDVQDQLPIFLTNVDKAIAK